MDSLFPFPGVLPVSTSFSMSSSALKCARIICSYTNNSFYCMSCVFFFILSPERKVSLMCRYRQTQTTNVCVHVMLFNMSAVTNNSEKLIIEWRKCCIVFFLIVSPVPQHICLHFSFFPLCQMHNNRRQHHFCPKLFSSQRIEQVRRSRQNSICV